MALIATPVNYLDRTRNKIVGGSILFDSSTYGNGQPILTKFIDTTRLNISAFIPSENYDSTRQLYFRLVATFTDGHSLLLWNVIVNQPDVGYMVPQKVYNMLDYGHDSTNPRYCSKVEILSSSPELSSTYVNNTNLSSRFATDETTCDQIVTTTPSYHFILWDLSSTIVVSQYVSPNVILSSKIVKCSYNEIASPSSNILYPTTPFVIPSSLIQITNKVSDTLTSNISWYISSTSDINNTIDGISVLYSNSVDYNRNTRMYINVSSNIYYNGYVFVTAENPEGLRSQDKFTLQLASIPIINASNVSYNLTTEDARFQIATIESTASGALTWDVRSSNTEQKYNNVLSINSTGYATIRNSFIYDNIVVTASNINNVASSSSGRATIVHTPIIKTPQTLLATVDHSTSYVYDKIHQIVPTAGPNLKWFYEIDSGAVIGQSNNLSINSNTGIFTIQPFTYVKGYIVFGVSNVLGYTSQKKVLARIVPQPYFISPNTMSVLLDGSEYNYTFTLTKYQGFNTRWSIRPTVSASVVPSTIQLNSSTGLFTIRNNTYINNTYIITARNIIPGLSDEESGSYSREVLITAGNSPSLTTPTTNGSNIKSMLYDDVLIPLYQPIDNTGDITWGITPQPGVPGVADLSIINKTNSSASLLVKYNHPVDAYINVFTSNTLNGYSNISFYLRVSQIPIISTPSTLFSNMLYTSSYTYRMNTITSNTNVRWYIPASAQYNNVVPAGLAINSTTGLLSISSNIAINQRVVVAASNIYGESFNTNPFKISISPIPEFVCPSLIYGTITNGVFDYTFSNISKGIHTWSIYDSTLRPIPNMSILNTNLGGRLTYTTTAATFTSSLVVSASNINGSVTTKRTYMDLLAQPIVGRLLTPLKYNLTDTDYTYQMTITNAYIFTRLGSNITWSVRNSTGYQLPGLTINPNTGLLRFQTNNNYNSTIIVRASTDPKYEGYSETSVNVNITQSPVLAQPNPYSITCNLSYGQQYKYQFSQTAIGVGNMNWSIYPNNIPGLSINNIGTLTLDSNYAINCNLSITASNTSGGYGTANLQLHIAHTPIIQDSQLIRGSVESNQVFQYTLNQIEKGTGTLFSRIVSSPTAPNILSFSSNGTLTVSSNTFLDTVSLGSPVTVQLSNTTGGACNFTFDLVLRKNPYFTLPSYLCNLRSPNSTDYEYLVTYNMSEVKYGDVNWYIGIPTSNSTISSLPGLTISKSGGIVLTSNIYLNCNISVIASNDGNGMYAASTKMVIAYNTTLYNPVKVAYNFYSTANMKFVYDIPYNSNEGTGPLRWSITDENSNPINYLSIRQTGRDSNTLTYGDGSSYIPAINKNVVVYASNIFNTVSSMTFKLVVTKTPNLYNPSSLIGSMEGTNDFTYTFVENTPNEMNDTVWYIKDNAFTNSLSIGSNTGILKFLHENKIDADITVAASNANAVSSNVTFHLNVVQTPQLIIPSQATVSHNFTSNDVPHTFQISSNYSTYLTGPLSWQIGNSNLDNISGLSINNNGRVTVIPSKYLDDTVYVLASNQNGGSNIIQFHATFANQPNIKKQDDVYLTLSSSNTFYLQYSNIWQVPGERINWSYSPKIQGLSISDSGLLTLQPDYVINCNITVTASNLLGYSSNVSSYISIFNPPKLISPNSNVLYTSVNVFSNYQIPIINTELRSGTLNWSYTTKIPASGLSIDANSGVLTLQSPYSLSNEITVRTATQVPNWPIYNSSITFSVYVLRDPLIQTPLYNLFKFYDTTHMLFTYQFVQSNIVTNTNSSGPIKWLLSSSYDSSANYLSINSNTGLLTYSGLMSNISINKDIMVYAVNTYNASNVVTVPMRITGDPSMNSNNITISPSSNSLSIYYSSKNASYVDYINISNITTTTNCNISTSVFPYTFTSLSPNQNYQLRITPYNFLGSNGVYFTSNATTLTSPMSNITITSRTNTTFGLSWDNTNYNFLQLQTYNTFSSVTCNTYIPSECNHVFSISNLDANRQYNLTLTPYNSNAVAGNPSYLSLFTLSDFGSTSPLINATSSNVSLTVYPSSSNYRNIALSWSNTSINSATSNASVNYSSDIYTYVIRNLYENTPYLITMKSYNNAGEVGINSNVTVTTKSSFSSALIVISQGNYIYDLVWGSGKFAYVKVMITKIKALSNGTYQDLSYELANNVTDTGLYNIELNPDYYKYIFTVTSYNSSGNIGQEQTITHYLI